MKFFVFCVLLFLVQWNRAERIPVSQSPNDVFRAHSDYQSDIIYDSIEISAEGDSILNSGHMPLLVIGTTVIDSEDEEKVNIQMNTLQNLASLFPRVRTVVFTSSTIYRERFGDQMDFVVDIHTNKYGTPIFREMMLYLEERYQSTFYGYCNGDLLFDSSIIQLLDYTNKQIQNHLLFNKTFLVGRRTNVFAPFPTMSADHTQNDKKIRKDGNRGSLFQSDAEDYFIFTKGTFDWDLIKPVVIGRPGYDNYLVSQVHHHTDEISFVDITNSLLVLHQTDSSGVLAGHRVAKDKMYNMKLIKKDWQKGRTEYSDWIIEQFPPFSFSVRKRYFVQDLPYDDDYLQEELSILKKFIKPTDVCVEFARHIVRGVLASLCSKLYVVVYNSYYIFEMRKSFLNQNVEILYGYGTYLSQGFDKHTISKKKDFSDYLSVVLNKNIHFDVLINNGRCRPQVAYTLRTHLKQDGIMVIRGSYEHYNVIENYYSLEESYPRSFLQTKEFNGLKIYRNNKPNKSVTFPMWW